MYVLFTFLDFDYQKIPLIKYISYNLKFTNIWAKHVRIKEA